MLVCELLRKIFIECSRNLTDLHEEEAGKTKDRLSGHEGFDDDELQHVEVEGDQGDDLASFLHRNQLKTENKLNKNIYDLHLYISRHII